MLEVMNINCGCCGDRLSVTRGSDEKLTCKCGITTAYGRIAATPTPTEDARERVKVLEEAAKVCTRLAEEADRAVSSSSPGAIRTSTMGEAVGLRAAAKAILALGNKQTPLSLSDADAGNPQKSAPPALGNKETDRHG